MKKGSRHTEEARARLRAGSRRRYGSQVDRFWSKVVKSDGCWEWRGARKTNGYGDCHVGTERLAHRAAYKLSVGSIPPGIHICHRCDNRRCVRPDHLFLGTHTDNMTDRSKKGRTAAGERIGTSKLTATTVAAIRAIPQSVTHAAVAQMFGIAPSHARRIRRGEAWAATDAELRAA